MALRARRLVGFSEVLIYKMSRGKICKMGQMVEWKLPVSDSRVQEDAVVYRFVGEVRALAYTTWRNII